MKPLLFRCCLSVVLICCGASGMLAQQKSASPQALPATRPKPDAKDFAKWEDYEDALLNWTIDQRLGSNGKQVTLSPAPPTGRYQIIFNPGVRADTFLLDTVSGRTWVQTKMVDIKDQPTIWIPRDRVDNEQELAGWAKGHPGSPAETPAK